VRLFGGTGLGDPGEALAGRIGRAARTPAAQPAATPTAAGRRATSGADLPVAGGLRPEAVRAMVGSMVAERLEQVTSTSAAPPPAAPTTATTAPPSAPAPPDSATDDTGAAPGAPTIDIDAVVDQLEQRLLAEIERRGGRYQGVF
jgi:hypothetical protein